jgi:hypothetical protein
MSDTRAYDTPLRVEVFDGEVVIRAVEGPMSVALTPKAAAETAKALRRAAEEAAAHASQTEMLRD